MQPELDFTAPYQHDVFGCSQAGATAAKSRIAGQCLQLLTLYQTHGPLTDRDAAELMHVERATICARRNELIDRQLVQAIDTVPGIYKTKNTRYGLATYFFCSDSAVS